MSEDAEKPPETKDRQKVKPTDSFFLLGVVFLVLGLTGDNNVAFLALGVAFMAIGAGTRVRGRKGGPK